jgi:hypothetical protein
MHNITFVNKANFVKLYRPNIFVLKMVHFCAVCGCCTRTDIVMEHLEGTLRICDVSGMGLQYTNLLTILERLKKSALSGG